LECAPDHEKVSGALRGCRLSVIGGIRSIRDACAMLAADHLSTAKFKSVTVVYPFEE
jgi:hypothetical protein